MAVDLFQRLQIDVLAFSFQIQRLAAAHAGYAAGGRQFGNHRQPIAQRHVRHLGIGQDRKRQRLQRIAGQDRVGFTEFNVAGRLGAI